MRGLLCPGRPQGTQRRKLGDVDHVDSRAGKDGLSGSVSSEGGEVGWTSYARGGNTVEYGADAPPQMDILPKSLLPQALRGGS